MSDTYYQTQLSKDPRYLMALQMLTNQHPMRRGEGFSRGLQALAAGLMGGRIRQESEEKQRAADDQKNMAMSFLTTQPATTQQYQDGRTINWNERPANYNMAAQLMGDPANADLQKTAIELAAKKDIASADMQQELQKLLIAQQLRDASQEKSDARHEASATNRALIGQGYIPQDAAPALPQADNTQTAVPNDPGIAVGDNADLSSPKSPSITVGGKSYVRGTPKLSPSVQNKVIDMKMGFDGLENVLGSLEDVEKLSSQAMGGFGAGGRAAISSNMGGIPGKIPLVNQAFQGDPGATAALDTLSKNMTLDKLGGKLGNQISDADRKFIADQWPQVNDTHQQRVAKINVLRPYIKRLQKTKAMEIQDVLSGAAFTPGQTQPEPADEDVLQELQSRGLQ